MKKSKNVRLEQDREWLRNLSESDRIFLSKYGFDNYQKLKEKEEREKISHRRTTREIEETAKIPQKFLKALEETLSLNETLKIELEETVNEKGEMQLLINELYEKIEGLEKRIAENDELLQKAEEIVAFFEKKGIKLEDSEKD